LEIRSCDGEVYKNEYERLLALLESERDGSSLPAGSDVRQDMNNFLFSMGLKRR
jgi:hypothetical protein